VSLAILSLSFCKRTPEKLARELMFICGLKCDQRVKESFLRLSGVFLDDIQFSIGKPEVKNKEKSMRFRLSEES